MQTSLRRMMSAQHLERGGTALGRRIAAAVLLQLSAGVGLAFVAGFPSVRAVLGDFDWVWLLAMVGALCLSFVGYYYGYQGIFRVEGGPRLSGWQMRAVVAAGFGGLLAPGGGALDRYALRSAGADEDQANVRVAALTGIEHGVLAIAGCAASIAVLAAGFTRPPANVTIPWAVLPVPGFLIAFWAAERYRERFRGRGGWRGGLGTFLDCIHIIWELFRHPLQWGWAVLGMTLFWLADAFAVWAGLAAFGFQMNLAALLVGFATGMVFTRRTGPLAGAGILALLLPVTIWSSGAPFAVAVVGVFVYTVLSVWLPMPVTLAFLPMLRTMGRRLSRDAAEIAEARPEPGLRRRAL